MSSIPIEWKISEGPVPYPEALAYMEARVAAIKEGSAPGLVWLLEHPALYTGGTGARKTDLLEARFPVFETGRGGQFTYHGPGQRVAYVMLDLKKLFAPDAPDLRKYIRLLEQWIIATLEAFGVEGFTRKDRVGVWVDGSCENSIPDSSHLTPLTEKKIAAIGVRVRGWVSYHGIAINVHPDLSHYSGIVPCGIREYGVTSLQNMAVDVSLSALDTALERHFSKVFTCKTIAQ